MAKEAPSLQYDAEQGVAANQGGFGLLAEMRGMRAEAISSWVRDALKKDTERRKEEIRRLNKGPIHGGDVRSDTMVVTERYRKTSTEWKSFQTLYGLTPEAIQDLDQAQCSESLQALNRAASILFEKRCARLPAEVLRKRDDLVALIVQENYEEAEKMSRTFLCKEESSVAEE
ncbi:hypothetical protein POX_b02730 [Penicillium oxalicum]|uniref:hypothetical protein n=1 Tax=Penicillium oxalicum TaxID=69781 RepID=UPI0020B870BF|nr:hypothetical protein POX_b02730 [Penicillium oxalicum]KAI2792689.1 hypothetical protein POX_b02730 [Penicillium oxalicum]